MYIYVHAFIRDIQYMYNQSKYLRSNNILLFCSGIIQVGQRPVLVLLRRDRAVYTRTYIHIYIYIYIYTYVYVYAFIRDIYTCITKVNICARTTSFCFVRE